MVVVGVGVVLRLKGEPPLPYPPEHISSSFITIDVVVIRHMFKPTFPLCDNPLASYVSLSATSMSCPRTLKSREILGDLVLVRSNSGMYFTDQSHSTPPKPNSGPTIDQR